MAGNGAFLIFTSSGSSKLHLQVLEVPRELIDFVKPVFMLGLDRILSMNPAKLLEKKLKIGERLMELYLRLRGALTGGSKSK